MKVFAEGRKTKAGAVALIFETTVKVDGAALPFATGLNGGISARVSVGTVDLAVASAVLGVDGVAVATTVDLLNSAANSGSIGPGSLSTREISELKLLAKGIIIEP